MKKQPEMTPDAWTAWVEHRPKCVKQLIAEFPYGHEIRFIDGSFFVIGWSEDDELSISPINPYADLKESRKNYRIFPAKLVRKHTLVQ